MIRTWKIKIKKTQSLKNLFDKWECDYRYSFNKSNWLINDCTCYYTKYDLRDLITPKEVNNDKQWLLETPKDIRAEAVFQNYSNWKSAFTNLKNNNINHFNIGFMKKKYKRHSYCIPIPGTAIHVVNNKTIKIYSNYTSGNIKLSKPLPNQIITKDNKLLSSHKIYWNGYNYYLLLSIERDKIHINNKRHKAAIDLGVRKLATTWDLNDNSYQFGNRKIVQIKDLLKKRDYYQSKKDKLNYIKIENRIKNLINELHHQTSTFLCKRYNNIILPELNVKDLIKKVKNKEFRKSILRMKICTFTELLKAKGEMYSTNIISEGVTERYSSRLCSSCKYINNKDALELKKCNNCGLIIDRDKNAAKNIYFMNNHL